MDVLFADSDPFHESTVASDPKAYACPETRFVEQVLPPNTEQWADQKRKGIPFSKEVPCICEKLCVPGMRVLAQRKQEMVFSSTFKAVSVDQGCFWIEENTIP